MNTSLKTMCGICPAGCGVEVLFKDGRLDRIRPLQDHPMGIVCTRGTASRDIVYSEDRLKYPQMRVGEKGDGKFQRISWEKALDTVASRLKEIKEKYGARALAEYSGRGGGFEQSIRDLFAIKGVGPAATKSFLFPFGSPNAASCSSICFQAYGRLAPMTTLGVEMGRLYPEFSKSKLIVIWGANPATDSPPIAMKEIINAKRGGAKVIVIDHRESEAAKKATHWVPIRPGTDGALALSMMEVIVREGLYDKEFTARWTVGFPELKEYLTQFSPKEAERITWVPAGAIEETARAIATAKHASVYTYTGLEYSNCGVQSIRALLILWAISGNLDVPGGNVFRLPASIQPNLVSFEPPPGEEAIGARKYPLFYTYTRGAHFLEFPRAILSGEPYPIRGLIINGASIITGYPDPDLWRQALANLDFLVVIDRFMTSDALYADILLPATTHYEIESYQRYPGYIQLRTRAVEPLAESRPDYQIYKELADRLGYGHLYPAYSQELLQFALTGLPVSLEELMAHPGGLSLPQAPLIYKKYEQGLLRKDGKPGFDTPSGKVEISSSILKEHGYEALPVYVEPKEGPLASPELAREYPLVLNTGARLMSAFRSQHLNIPRLLNLQPRPQVIIHRADAEARGIQNGERVWVVTPRGKVPFYALVTSGITPGVVEANAGGGSILHSKEWQEANVNYLTDHENRDPISGFPVYKALLCDVRKISLDRDGPDK